MYNEIRQQIFYISELYTTTLMQSSTRWKYGDSWIREVHWHKVLEPADGWYRRPGSRTSQCNITILLYRLPCRAHSDAWISSWNCSNKHGFFTLNSSVFQLPMWDRAAIRLRMQCPPSTMLYSSREPSALAMALPS